jgi:hypothetical protein
MTVNNRLNAEEIEAIRKRVEDTSFERVYVKGDPWKGYEVRDNGNGIVVAETHTKVDAEFIAHAREDVPKLLAEIERLRGLLFLEQSEYLEMKRKKNEALSVINRLNGQLSELIYGIYEHIPEGHALMDLAEAIDNDD